MPDTVNNKRNPYYAKAGQLRQTKGRQTKRVIFGPTDFSLLDPSIQVFDGALSRRTPTGFTFTANPAGRSRVAWLGFPVGTRVRFNCSLIGGGGRFRAGPTNELGPTGTLDLAQPFVSGQSYTVDHTFAGDLGSRVWIGFILLFPSATIIVSDWRVDYAPS